MCVILPQTIWVIVISYFCGYFYFDNYIHRNQENQQEIYIQSQYLYDELVFGRLFLIIKKKQFEKIYIIIRLHNFQIQVTKHTFSSNDRNCENTLFHHPDEIKKIEW